MAKCIKMNCRGLKIQIVSLAVLVFLPK